jgi:hypothetical protein
MTTRIVDMGLTKPEPPEPYSPDEKRRLEHLGLIDEQCAGCEAETEPGEQFCGDCILTLGRRHLVEPEPARPLAAAIARADGKLPPWLEGPRDSRPWRVLGVPTPHAQLLTPYHARLAAAFLVVFVAGFAWGVTSARRAAVVEAEVRTGR